MVAGLQRRVWVSETPRAEVRSVALEQGWEDDGDLTLCLPERLPASTHEVVLANILAGPLVELAPTIAGQVAPGGRLALSGILANQAETVHEAYLAQGLQMDAPHERDDWICLSGYRGT